MARVHISSKIGEARHDMAWRADDGTIHASVTLGDSYLVFDSSQEAREHIAACVQAAEALEALESEGKPGTEGSKDDA